MAFRVSVSSKKEQSQGERKLRCKQNFNPLSEKWSVSPTPEAMWLEIPLSPFSAPTGSKSATEATALRAASPQPPPGQALPEALKEN